MGLKNRDWHPDGSPTTIDDRIGRIKRLFNAWQRVNIVPNSTDEKEIAKNAAHDVASLFAFIPAIQLNLSLTIKIGER